MILMYLISFEKLGKLHNIIITKLEGMSAYLYYPGPSRHSDGTPHSRDGMPQKLDYRARRGSLKNSFRLYKR